jgi:hypothetical protein
MKNFLMDFFSPERSLVRYIVGTAALTVLVQFFYDLSKEFFGTAGAALLALVLIFIVVGIFWWDYRQTTRGATLRPREKPITPHKGLILLISPGKKELPLTAIEHHLESLKYCWLVASQGSLDTAKDLEVEISRRHPEIKVFDARDTMVDPENIESTYDVVNRIYEVMTPSLGLKESEIVADITGGQKPMTAGMALACSTPIRKMQYMKTLRDKDGEPIRGAMPLPVLINTIPDMSPAEFSP